MFCFSLVWFWIFVMEAHVAKAGPKTTLNFWPGCHHLSSARITGSGFTFSALFCFPETGSEVSQVGQKPSMEPRMTSELLTISSAPPPELQACSTHQVYEMLGTEVMVSCKIGKYSTNRAKSPTLVSLAFSRFNFTIFICVYVVCVCAYMLMPDEVRWGHQTPWSWFYRLRGALIFKPGSPVRTANVLNHKANFPTPDSHSVNFTLELGVSWYFPMPSMPSIYSSFLCAVTNTVGPVL